MGTEDLLGHLLKRPGFRADLLYFIRLAGNYAVSIFVDCRQRASDKQKAEFSHWLGLDVGKGRSNAKPSSSQKELEARLWKQFLQRNPNFVSAVDKSPHVKQSNWSDLAFGRQWFDIFKTDFPKLLAEMPVSMRERLSRSLQKDHLLPWTTKDFLRAVENLTAYRHWLEHPEDKIKKGELRPTISDSRLFEILGLMLLPFLGNHLVGRIRHHERRIGLRRSNGRADHVASTLADAMATRRDTSKFMNGLKRRIDNDSIRQQLTRKYGNPPGDKAVHRIAKEEAKKRRDLEHQKKAMLDLHRRYFDDHVWPRYNYENFLIRFAFIGRRRIQDLEEKLGYSGDQRPDFINAIEPAFTLAMDVALIIHVWLTELEDEGLNLRKSKNNAFGPVIPALRNAIAHGDWIWAVADKSRNNQTYAFRTLLEELLSAPHKGGLRDWTQWQNSLLTRLEGVLRPCGWTYVHAIAQTGDDPNQMPARYVVKRWTTAQRVRFASREFWFLDKRPALRRMAAQWMRDIAEVRKAGEKN